MIHLYIDTNVFLSLYHFTSDELVELDKLSALLKQKQASLYLPEQTRLEFSRNRDNKIADALKKLREQKFSFQFPQFCRDYPEYAELRQLETDVQKKLNILLSSAGTDIDNNKLQADRATSALFKAANLIKTSPEQISRAQLRMSLGSPPGKDGSLGDAINWEALLESVPAGQDLVFISGDKDYVSPLKDDAFHSFLEDEWSEKKSGKIIFHKRIGSFFKVNFPNSPLATDLEKESLIKDLRDSSSFATTHSVIAKLASYSKFNNLQRNQLLKTALANNQVYLIADDPDVKEFFEDVIVGHEKELPAEDIADWSKRVAGSPVISFDLEDDD